LRQRKSWLTTATRKRPEVSKPGNRREMRDPTDHIREVPIGATETIRRVCKDTLQSLVTTFTNMELEIKQGDRFTRTTEAIADYVEREYSKEMGLLVKNQKENEPEEPVMPDKEEAKLPFVIKSPFVIKKYEIELKQFYFKKER
jgi:aspartyl/asparaginyl-tRNA synthetase